MRKTLFLLCVVARLAFGQGGPPMLTDDPGTPGNGHWENNFAIILAHVPSGWALDAVNSIQIPFQLAKKIGRVGLDAEFGPLISSVGHGELIYCIVAGTEVTKIHQPWLRCMRLHACDLKQDLVALNRGWRHILNDHAIWIGSLGHEIHSGDNQPLALIGYFGVQLVY